MWSHQGGEEQGSRDVFILPVPRSYQHLLSQVRPGLQAAGRAFVGCSVGFLHHGKVVDVTRLERGMDCKAMLLLPWSTVTFPFPSSLWKLQCGGAVTVCCWVSVLIFTLFLGLSLIDLLGTFW